MNMRFRHPTAHIARVKPLLSIPALFLARGSNPEEIKGLILVKELLQFWQAQNAPCVSQLDIRPMPHIPADTPMFDVLRLFQVCEEGGRFDICWSQSLRLCHVNCSVP
jgi:hypothetical protein